LLSATNHGGRHRDYEIGFPLRADSEELDAWYTLSVISNHRGQVIGGYCSSWTLGFAHSALQAPLKFALTNSLAMNLNIS
jgi:hypothetical protein